MPTSVTLPPCMMDCYKALYPDLDFSRVAFYSGLPAPVSAAGFTMASGAASPDIRVYIDNYQACDKDTFLNIAHELVHVIQIQGMLGGGRIPGSWATYYTSHFLGCTGRGSKCANELEKEAYDWGNGVVGGSCGTDAQVRDFVDTYFAGLAPCKCLVEPWPVARMVGGQTLSEALQQASPALVKTSSSVGRTWCSLLNWPAALAAGAYSIFGFSNTGGAIGSGIGTVAGGIVGGIIGGFLGGPLGAVLGAFVGALLGAVIGGAIGWAIDGIAGWVGGLLSGPSARIFFTAFDGSDWVIPDVPVSQDHSLTSAGPALAAFDGKLFLVYKGKDSDDLWCNTFDGQTWLGETSITHNGHNKTDAEPALAVYDNKLFLVYKGSGSDDLWYNWYDSGWQPEDRIITLDGHSRTSAGPALAVYNGLLYCAYKGSGSDDLWYNWYDSSLGLWQRSDSEITHDGHSKTSDGPALAVYQDRLYCVYKGSGSNDLWYNWYDAATGKWLDDDIQINVNHPSQTSRQPALALYNGLLYCAYRGADSDDIWYNTFDGRTWQDQDTKVTRDGNVLTAQGPALAAFNKYLFMVYRDNS